ncbi:protein-L-isoaspartate(D-aspartate) O-methyltransferase [Novimethylophilus kurashikiensis]|uniref:Protein-L-isoaspartate O-methyltransferase n=1 Tax=Novimethylophilus kurashikiensis TaxID=1825523 RepID=A0A2R5FC00_9PROT|nr:protein-L-isoaspartate(D-aspartate) O-methyltransferase [Novimethylophilus kurashikiensis]GBG15742.1 protein-L-isoaspartate(D-aspartate) O-methyltransferase [Novimethylophilus kurashikiensis]
MSVHAGIGMTSQRTRERMIGRLREQGITDEVVLAAMLAVPRHIFVEEALASRAYEDVSLPIGLNQTISQPYIVARMTELLRDNKPLGRVLEIGTGCGYQTSVLSRVANEVFSIERIAPLLTKAKSHFRELRLRNVKVKHGDGHQGLPEVAPFDGIIVTAGATHIPEELLRQLAVGGRLVIPVGSGGAQMLTLVERLPESYRKTELEAVKFVPLLSGAV